MGRPRTHDDETAEALLAEAERLLVAAGAEAVTVRGVAEAVGVSTRAVYTTFGGKDGLIAALRLRGFDRLGEVTRGMRRSRDPLADLERAGPTVYRLFAADNPEMYDLMFDDCRIGDWRDPRDAERALDALMALRELLQRGADAGAWPQSDVDDRTVGYWSAVHGMATLERQGLLGATEADATRIWRTQCEALVAGYRRD